MVSGPQHAPGEACEILLLSWVGFLFKFKKPLVWSVVGPLHDIWGHEGAPPLLSLVSQGWGEKAQEPMFTGQRGWYPTHVICPFPICAFPGRGMSGRRRLHPSMCSWLCEAADALGEESCPSHVQWRNPTLYAFSYFQRGENCCSFGSSKNKTVFFLKPYLKGSLSHRLLTIYSEPHSIKASYNCL